MPRKYVLLKIACSSFPAAAYASPPTISQHPLSTTVVRNDPVTLDCRAAGDPAPDVEWYRDGLPVDMDPASRMLLPDGSLFLLRASVRGRRGSDAGVYWCVASNAEGVARSRNATLDIACEYCCDLIERNMWGNICVFFSLNKQEANLAPSIHPSVDPLLAASQHSVSLVIFAE